MESEALSRRLPQRPLSRSTVEHLSKPLTEMHERLLEDTESKKGVVGSVLWRSLTASWTCSPPTSCVRAVQQAPSPAQLSSRPPSLRAACLLLRSSPPQVAGERSAVRRRLTALCMEQCRGVLSGSPRRHFPSEGHCQGQIAFAGLPVLSRLNS